MVIRPMEKWDLDQALVIENQSFRHPWNADLFIGELDRGKISFNFVAVEEGPEEGSDPCLTPATRDHENGARYNDKTAGRSKILGFVMAWHVADELHINNLAVGRTARRRGVATQLIENLLHMGRERGATCCTLEVRISNLGAISLYQRFGFQPAGLRRGYYRDGEDALILDLHLGT